jgi:hypothetical protein
LFDIFWSKLLWKIHELSLFWSVSIINQRGKNNDW